MKECTKKHKTEYSKDDIDDVIANVFGAYMEKMNAFIEKVKEEDACPRIVCKVMFMNVLFLIADVLDFFYEYNNKEISKEMHFLGMIYGVVEMCGLNMEVVNSDQLLQSNKVH